MAQIRHPGHRSNDGSAYAEDAARAFFFFFFFFFAGCVGERIAVYAWICKPILAAGQPLPQPPPARADDEVPVPCKGLVPSRTGSPAIDVPFGVGPNEPAILRALDAYPRWQEESPRMSSLSS